MSFSLDAMSLFLIQPKTKKTTQQIFQYQMQNKTLFIQYSFNFAITSFDDATKIFEHQHMINKRKNHQHQNNNLPIYPGGRCTSVPPTPHTISLTPSLVLSSNFTLHSLNPLGNWPNHPLKWQRRVGENLKRVLGLFGGRAWRMNGVPWWEWVLLVRNVYWLIWLRLTSILSQFPG